MGWIGRTDASVRSEAAGDALRIGKASRRGDRVCPADPKGRVFKAVGRRPAPLAMREASLRGAVLAQGFENAVQPMINSPAGSYTVAFASTLLDNAAWAAARRAIGTR